ncbi:MAG: heme exporter protein CcmD [Microthrixaceae bacterium]
MSATAQLLAQVSGGSPENDAPYIIGAWAVTFAAVGGYALAVIRRGRRLSKVVPADRRRWM